VQYTPGKGAVEKVMQMCAGGGYSILEFKLEQPEGATDTETRALQLQLRGRRGVEALVIAIGDIKGVVSSRLSRPQQTS
jgi:hypothetical protein